LQNWPAAAAQATFKQTQGLFERNMPNGHGLLRSQADGETTRI